MGVEPDDTSGGAVVRREPGERTERNRMVTAQHERLGAACDRFSDERGDTRACLEDLRQVTRALVRNGGAFGLHRLHVAVVVDGVAERPEPILETRVANRGRPHVDAAAALAEVEGGADDGHRAGTRSGHGPESTWGLTWGEPMVSPTCPLLRAAARKQPHWPPGRQSRLRPPPHARRTAAPVDWHTAAR